VAVHRRHRRRRPSPDREIGPPQTRSLQTATAAIAIVLPTAEDDRHEIGIAYDDGRAAERVLIAAGMLGLGAGIAVDPADVRPAIGELLGLPADRYIRTIIPSATRPRRRALRRRHRRSPAATGRVDLPRTLAG
jgi:hypothetical protein